jgi:hypothetical protein
MTDAVMQPITEIKKEETPIRLCHVCGIEAGSHLVDFSKFTQHIKIIMQAIIS